MCNFKKRQRGRPIPTVLKDFLAYALGYDARQVCNFKRWKGGCGWEALLEPAFGGPGLVEMNPGLTERLASSMKKGR